MTDAGRKNSFLVVVLYLAVALAAFLSFNNNAFLVASEKRFASHQEDSELLVLDGILRSLQTGADFRLGVFYRPPADIAGLSLAGLYSDKIMGGEFSVYKSQYGLQGRFFHWVADTFSDDLRVLHAVASASMALIVVLVLCVVRRELSTGAAVLACLALIASPWMVLTARNLYWVPATWFLPLLIAFSLGKQALERNGAALILAVALYAAFLVKFLCGFEFITSVGLAAVLPIAYFAVKHGFGYWRATVMAGLCGVVFLLAFVTAAVLQVRSLSTDWNEGWAEFSTIAQKRLSSSDPQAIADAVCQNDRCKQVYKDSLTSNRLLVVARYFVFPDFLPWTHLIYDSANLSEQDRDLLKAALTQRTSSSLNHALSNLSKDFYGYAGVTALNAAAFLAFLAAIAISLRKAPRECAALAVVALAAPLSWFVLAKGHSYIHYHVNYVLWCLPLVPVGAALLAQGARAPSRRSRGKRVAVADASPLG